MYVAWSLPFRWGSTSSRSIRFQFAGSKAIPEWRLSTRCIDAITWCDSRQSSRSSHFRWKVQKVSLLNMHQKPKSDPRFICRASTSACRAATRSACCLYLWSLKLVRRKRSLVTFGDVDACMTVLISKARRLCLRVVIDPAKTVTRCFAIFQMYITRPDRNAVKRSSCKYTIHVLRPQKPSLC